MTPEQIAAEYDRIWQEQSSRPAGPDPEAILHIVTAKSGKPLPQVRAIILDYTFTPPN